MNSPIREKHDQMIDTSTHQQREKQFQRILCDCDILWKNTVVQYK